MIGRTSINQVPAQWRRETAAQEKAHLRILMKNPLLKPEEKAVLQNHLDMINQWEQGLPLSPPAPTPDPVPVPPAPAPEPDPVPPAPAPEPNKEG